MTRLTLAAFALAAFALALIGCAPPDTLEALQDEGIHVAIEDAALSVTVELDVDAVERADCVTLAEAVRAEAGGLALAFDQRGGWQEADGLFGCDGEGCGACVAPRMQRAAADFDVDAPGTVVLEDDTRAIQIDIEGLFAERTMTRTSPSTARVGADVALAYSRPQEALDTLNVSFVATGQGGACDAAFSLDLDVESEDGGTGLYQFRAVAPDATNAPACAGPWVGALTLSFTPRFVIAACEGTARCTAARAPIDVELPFTVVP
jgi:hypothetical protein